MRYDVVVVGGGAAGFFTAINIAEQNPRLKVVIIERGKEVLSKVRISGGGRCNVTHACFDPKEFTQFYPRGAKELLGPFHQFCSGDTIGWFSDRGVALKIESDGRMFPESNASQTIIDCFVQSAQKAKIEVLTSCSVQQVFQKDASWKLDTTLGGVETSAIVFASGSNPKMWDLLSQLGHRIITPVPSLFTFNIKDSRIQDLMGVSALATVTIKESGLEATGPLLITHWGMSGPGILRLSAWGARELSAKNYQFLLGVNWLPDETEVSALNVLQELKEVHSKKVVSKKSPFDFPNRLWERFVLAAGIAIDKKWADTSKKELQLLASQLTNASFKVNGKSTFKEEFVTAGGIDLKEVNFKTMESKLLPNVFFAGEILNIDAITGGFNFQNAWTTGFLAAQALSKIK